MITVDVNAGTQIAEVVFDDAKVDVEQMEQSLDEGGYPVTAVNEVNPPPVTNRMNHSADYNPLDYQVSLSELLRVIQLYNSRSYYCGAPGTEDGYALEIGNGDTETCTPHDSDYSPQDWRIGLTELLRLVQFYNSYKYHSDPDGEDGFSIIPFP